ncbi:AraC-type DNA-binding domain-containing protein [gamma proteobacterium HdN1]|nr:AraC-type DNA-binding domain-containing protein [gamma proteobacterium HdN1]
MFFLLVPPCGLIPLSGYLRFWIITSQQKTRISRYEMSGVSSMSTGSVTTSSNRSAIRISASLVPVCVQVGVSLGVNPSYLQRWVDSVDLEALEAGLIDANQVSDLVKWITDCTDRTDVAFLVGEVFDFDFFPAVTTYLRSLDCLRNLRCDIGFIQRLFSPQFCIEVKEVGEWIEVRLGVLDAAVNDQLDPLIVRFAVSGVMTFCQKLLASLLQEDGFIEGFYFRESEPDSVDDYRNYLKSPLHFGADFDGFIVPRSLLDLPLRGALPMLNAKARARLVEVSNTLIEADTLAEKLLEAFHQHHRLLSLPLPATAAHFNVSERTLQRRLQAESVTFFELQEQAKRLVATELLKKGTSTDDVAEQLGFADRRSFCRAFKRWFDKSPSAFRAEITS